MKKINYLIILLLIFLISGCGITEEKIESSTTQEVTPLVISTPQEDSNQVAEFTIEADDNGLYPNIIHIPQGTNVKLTFKVKEEGVYWPTGFDFRTEIWDDQMKVGRGQSKTVEFTAEETFAFDVYLHNSQVKKFSGQIIIE